MRSVLACEGVSVKATMLLEMRRMLLCPFVFSLRDWSCSGLGNWLEKEVVVDTSVVRQKRC